jgi:hypothetical protein
MRIHARLLGVVALVSAAGVLSACGGAEKPAAAPGSPDNPLVAKQTEGTSAGRSNEAQAGGSSAPGYQKLVEKQSGSPKSRFTPCNLVSRAQARTILDGPVSAPFEAPQGPTCIYRSQDGKAFITLSVQALDFDHVRQQLRGRQALELSGRRAYCGTAGQPMLYVSLSRSRVLSVAAPCGVAKRFAALAVARLSA